MRVIYMGTPVFAIAPLEHMVEGGLAVVGVYTQPDKPSGRGMGMTASPVKAFAEEHGLRVFQTVSFRPPSAHAEMASLKPDVIVVAAYGRILPKEVLALAPWGCVNVHPSLLPRHRGPSPVASSILEGDKKAGVTLILLDEGMDSGPIIAQREEPVLPQDTAESLTARLFHEGGRLLMESLPAYCRGDLVPRPQDESLATYSRKLTKEDGFIQWEIPATRLWRQVRAYSPWPGAYSRWQGKLLKVLEAVPLPGIDGGTPGKVVALGSGAPAPVGVATGEGVLGLIRVQLEGKRGVDAGEFLQGYRGFPGSVLPC